MRKIIVFLLVVPGLITLQAQDIVHHGDSCYLFNPSFESCITLNYYDTCAFLRHNGLWESVQQYTVSQPTLVYGIAVTMFRNSADTSTSGVPVKLYINADTAFVPIDSILRYSKRTNFLYKALSRGTTDTVRSVSPCYEYYFREPHRMQGSFYVGYNFNVHLYPIAPPDDYRNHFTAGIVLQNNQPWYNINNMMPQQQIYWGCVFPIVQPERIGCEAPEAEVINRGADYAELAWDMDGDSCQLSVAPYNMPADSGQVVSMVGNSFTATGLDTNVYYAVRLRTQCHHSCPIHADTVVWSVWGAPTLFYLGSEEPDTTGIGIHDVDVPMSLNITPNPTTGALTVSCVVAIDEVELFDMQGRCALSDKADCSTVVLDLKALPTGTYVLVAHTAKGLATRTVEKR